MALIIGIATQMQDIAQSTADKAIDFSDDMNNAMECATKGVPLRVCSPQLLEYQFDEEQEQFQEALNTIGAEAQELLELAQQHRFENSTLIEKY
jgi:hypothetical protein